MSRILEIIEEGLANYLDTGSLLVIRTKRLVGRVNDLKIHVYSDHVPPHFHVISTQRSINAKLLISDFSIYKNYNDNLQASDLRKIKDYFSQKPDMKKLMISEFGRMNKK